MTMTMKRPSALPLGIMLAVACIGIAQPSEARQGKGALDSLRGLPSLSVVVEELEAKAEADGLHSADIRTDVELQLRLAGIRVIPKDEASPHPAMPYLSITVTTIETDKKYAYGIDVGVGQYVSLWNGRKVFAETWEHGAIGTVGASSRLRSSVRDHVKDVVNRFINDWLTVNPK